MGSTGTGNFSDYKNFPRAIKGVTGADDSKDKCALAFSNFSQQKITKFTAKINERPRKKLNFSTPKECFYKDIS